MPKTPTGAKRPADVIGNAVNVMRVLTGVVSQFEFCPVCLISGVGIGRQVSRISSQNA
jgi:hypothetical protein